MASVDSVTSREFVESVGPGDDVSGGFTGTEIDMHGAGALAIVAGLGGGSADGSYDLTVQEAPESTATPGSPGSWTDVGTGDLLGSFSTGVQADAGISERVGYAGHRRFVRVQVDEGSAATTAPTAYAVGVKGELDGFAF